MFPVTCSRQPTNPVHDDPPGNPIWVRALRWLGRFWALLLVALWLLFLIGEGRGNLLAIFRAEPALTSALLAMVAGLLLGCWRERWGAALIVLGIAAFGVAEGGVPSWPFLLPAASALLFFVVWRCTSRSRPEPAATPKHPTRGADVENVTHREENGGPSPM